MTTTPTSPNNPPAPRKRNWKKIALLAASVLVVGAGLTVALLPTLLSTSPARSFILGQVNSSLAGKVEVDSWSLGWFSGVTASGIKVYDDQKRLAITIPSVTTGLTVAGVLSGSYHLGDTVIDSPNLVLVELYPDGTTNLQRITKPSSSTSAKFDSKPSGSLPDVQGNITIKNLTGTIQGDAIGAPLRIAPSNLAVQIPDLRNKPITNDIQLAISRDGAPRPGTLTAKGTAQAIYNGVVDTSKLTADQSLTLRDFDLAALSPFLAKSGVSLSGLALGDLTLKATGLDNAALTGDLKLSDLTATGPALKGDTFRSPLITIPTNLTTSKGPDGSPLFKLDNVGVQSEALTLSFQGQVTQKSLTNLAASKAPGTPGNLKLQLSVPNVATLASQLKNTLALGPDLTLQSGVIASTVNLDIANTALSVTGNTRVQNVTGTRAGRAIRPTDLTADYDASAVYSVDGLYGLNITTAKLASSFLTASLAGTLDNLTYDLDLDLAKARDEAAQLSDMTGTELAGRVISKGSLQKQGDSRTLDAQATLTNVRAVLPGKDNAPPTRLDIDRLLATTGVLLTPKDGKPLGTADIRTLKLIAGPDNAPILNVDAVASLDLTNNSAPSFDLKTFSIPNLSELQRRFGAFLPALSAQQIQFLSGSLNASTAGSYTNNKLTLSKPVTAQLRNLTLTRQGVQLLTNESLDLSASAASDDGFKTALANASLRSTFATADLKDLALNLQASGGGGGAAMLRSGSISLRSDNLAKVDALVKTVSPNAIAVTQGALDINLLASTKDNATTLDVQSLKVTSLQLSKGAQSYRLPSDVDLKLTVTANTNPGTQKLSSLSIPALQGSLGVASVQLNQPIQLTSLDSPSPSLQGELALSGKLQPLADLYQFTRPPSAPSASQPAPYTYIGDFTAVQTLSSANNLSSAKGSLNIKGLQVRDASGKLLFTEDNLAVANDAAYNTATTDLNLTSFTLDTASSKALTIKASGLIRDTANQRVFEKPLVADISYDLAKLVELIKPLLSPENRAQLEPATFKGVETVQWTLSGSYPAVPAPAPGGAPDSGASLAALQKLKIDGQLAAGQIFHRIYGIDLQQFGVSLSIDNGIIRFSQPKPAAFNEGTLDLDGIVIDATTPDPRLTTPPNKKIISNLSINKAFLGLINKKLNQYNNPLANAAKQLFTTLNTIGGASDDASGRLNVEIVEARRFPLSDLYKKTTPDNDGRLETNLTASNFELTGGFIGKIFGLLDNADILGNLGNILGGNNKSGMGGNASALVGGEISRGHVVLEKGTAAQDIAMRLSVGTFRMNGNVRLADNAFQNMTAFIGAAKLAGLGGGEISIPVNGTLADPKPDLSALLGNLRRVPGLNKIPGLDKLPPIPGLPSVQPPATTPPNNSQPPGAAPGSPPNSSAQPPAQGNPPPFDPIQELQKALQRDKDKKKKEKK